VLTIYWGVNIIPCHKWGSGPRKVDVSDSKKCGWGRILWFNHHPATLNHGIFFYQKTLVEDKL
jgi:hypothetical protein